jgi:hypothetical protein
MALGVMETKRIDKLKYFQEFITKRNANRKVGSGV